MVLEKQNKELKVKLEEVEKAKDATLAMESRLEDKRRHVDQYKEQNGKTNGWRKARCR